MNVNHINAVSRATKLLLSSYFAIEVTPLKLRADRLQFSPSDITVALDITGELSGHIICTLTNDTAKSIVGLMMGGMEIAVMDEMGFSAIQEFGNWIAGATASELSNENCIIDVTPPVVDKGKFSVCSSTKFITIPFDSNIGVIDVHISLWEKAS